MKLKYINRIKANLSIYANKKTNNLLEGTYKSVYKGKSMNFENLREYVIGDEVKDIDWKASSRTGSLLVKQYIAEKKHNILLVMDTSKEMDGDAQSLEPKKEIALYTAGTIGYLAIKNGDYVGMIFSDEKKIQYKPFKYDLYSLERYLTEYESASSNGQQLEQTIEYLCRNIKRRMVIFVITDLKGINDLSDKILREVTTLHDVLFINVSDASISTPNSFDLESQSYIPLIFQNDKQMASIERKIKHDIYKKNVQRTKKYKIDMTSIGNQHEINLKILELLERHKYASNR